MSIVAGLLLSVGAVWGIVASVMWWQAARDRNSVESRLGESIRRSEEALDQFRREEKRLSDRIAYLEPWQGVADADAESSRVKLQTAALLDSAKQEAESLRKRAAGLAALTISDAEAEAKKIAGSAWEAKKNADQLAIIVQAMRNRIEGYGDEYLAPSSQVLDELAEQMSHTTAGKRLKEARAESRAIVRRKEAASCDWAKGEAADAAARVVLDAFNGRVDAVLARVKHDNVGKLSQEIKDAQAILKELGETLGRARITREYAQSRLNELRWAATVSVLKHQWLEQQRAARAQMREEARVRREVERELRESAKQEETLKAAVAKAERQMAAASDLQRSKFEIQLRELQAKLLEAESRGQRAISMAQQTKRGHVYIISNVGSFGEGVLKIGMTRRLDPMDRIWELGDSSVPFDFDVHAMIMSEDAPNLEWTLHRHFLLRQINKVNHRKEFFRLNIAELKAEIEQLGLSASWTMAAEAREFRETQAIERLIESNPEAKQRWLDRQLQLDPTDIEVLKEQLIDGEDDDQSEDHDA